MKRTAQTVDRLLAQLPTDDPERHDLQARAARYGRTCGCSTAALSLAASALLVAVYLAAGGDLDLRTGFASVAFVIGAALVGKLAGLLVATFRLRLLGRSIDRRLRDVHVH